jgi:hypothetical protein
MFQSTQSHDAEARDQGGTAPNNRLKLAARGRPVAEW